MRRLKQGFLGIALLTLWGCATPPVATQFDNTRVYAKSKDEVWTNLVAFFATQNIQIKTIEKDSGVIYAERAAFDQNLADCGVDYLYQDIAKIASFNVLVIPRSGKIGVTVTSDFKVSRLGPYNATKISPCESTGMLERQILNSI